MGADRQGRRIEGGCRKIIQERAAPAVSRGPVKFAGWQVFADAFIICALLRSVATTALVFLVAGSRLSKGTKVTGVPVFHNCPKNQRRSHPKWMRAFFFARVF
jgi:hypothetical protein